MADFQEHFKRAIADETVRWIRYGIFALVAVMLLSGVTYVYGGRIKHMVMAPFTKVHDVAVHGKDAVKGAAGSIRDTAGDIKDGIDDKAKVIGGTIVDNINAAKEHVPELVDKTRKGVGVAADKVRDTGGNLKERYQNWRGKNHPTDDVVE